MKVPGLERLFRAAERRRWTLALALATPGWIAVVRMLLERELSMSPSSSPRPPFPWFAHIFVFYLALSVCLTALLAREDELTDGDRARVEADDERRYRARRHERRRTKGHRGHLRHRLNAKANTE